MKAKVIRPFKEKGKGIRHEAGDVIDVSQKRFDEINSTERGSYVAKVAQEQKDQKEPQEEKKSKSG